MRGILIKLDLLSSLRCIPWVPHRQREGPPGERERERERLARYGREEVEREVDERVRLGEMLG